ncbi:MULTISPECIES: DUF4240 domain-containing protein [unclassified Nonomuraea]|uniref:DUF4240 domain-containing protein n=1 Tax=unclassified Nonomuraea TaxID=2593643 RepID=UPI0035C24285
MNVDEFWLFIRRSQEVTSDPDERLQWLAFHLARSPLARIVDFQVLLNQIRRRSDTYGMWEAADLILDGYCSTDSFWYFQAWLIGLGRDTFDLVVADPDNLADVPEVRRLADRPMQEWADDEWPEWEALSYVAAEAYEEATGEEEGVYDTMAERGYANQSDPNPTGLPRDSRNPAEVARRLPRLSRMFH